MPKLNWKFILYNLRDVREQIDEIVFLAEAGTLDEADFQVKMEHAYHHMNFAWNIRHASAQCAAECSDDDFNEWSKLPSDLEEYKV